MGSPGPVGAGESAIRMSSEPNARRLRDGQERVGSDVLHVRWRTALLAG